MTAAVLQGTPVTTFDVDLWLEIPPRQYIRVLNLARGLGAQIVANTVVVLPGDLTINFVYEVTGLASFSAEFRRCQTMEWVGRKVRVLPLARIYKSKKAVGRPKDIAHLPLLKQIIRLRRRIAQD